LVNRKFFKDEAFLHEFEYYDAKPGVTLGGLSRITTIELSKLGRLVEKAVEEMTPAERWAFCIKYISDKEKRDKVNEILGHEEGIAMASQVLVSISRDEHQRSRLLSEYKFIVDTQSKVVQAERDGRREEMIKEAEKMKKRGIHIDQIVEYTGLSAEEIAKL
jgi:predicted transposase/invertase (TIGR01784 family)